MGNKSKILLAAVLAALAVAAFRPYFGAPFIFDDIHTVRDNPHLSHLSPIYFFTHPESASAIPATLTRPILTFSYALDFHRAGADPDAFRLTNLLIHLLNAVLIILLTRETPNLKPLAPAAGILFLIHPLAAGSVAYVSDRSTLLSSTFYLAAMLVFAKRHWWSTRPRIVICLTAMALLHAAGLFTKEVAATLPGAIVLWWLAFDRQDRKRTARGLAVTAVVLTAFLVYRRAFSAAVLFPAARPRPVWQYAASQARVFWTYIRMVFVPTNLALEHDAWMPANGGDIFSATFILSALGIIALVIAAGWALQRKLPEPAFAALFAGLYLLPTSSVIPLTMTVNENRPYLSLLLFIWAIPALVNAAGLKPARGYIALAIPVLLLTAMTATRGRTFQNEERVWRDAVKNAPGLARPLVNLGAVYSSYGRMNAARACYERATALEPCHALALANLGNLAVRASNPARAEQLYRRALQCDPGHLSAITALADLLLEQHRDREAAAVLDDGLKLLPDASEIEGRLGIYYALRRGEREKGITLLRSAAEHAIKPARRDYWQRAIEEIGN